MGFKVLDNDQVDTLDDTWREWTGLGELLAELDPIYIIRRVQCWKANNVKPDIFKYGLLIEIAGENDIHARDVLQVIFKSLCSQTYNAGLAEVSNPKNVRIRGSVQQVDGQGLE